jgi:hypothetical protein
MKEIGQCCVRTIFYATKNDPDQEITSCTCENYWLRIGRGDEARWLSFSQFFDAVIALTHCRASKKEAA